MSLPLSSPLNPFTFSVAMSVLGGKGQPLSIWRTEHFNRSIPEPAPLRPDRLGGFGRAARFGKFRTPGSSREPLFTLPPRGCGYTSFPPEPRLGGEANTIASDSGLRGPIPNRRIGIRAPEASAPSPTQALLSKQNDPYLPLANVGGFPSRSDRKRTETHGR